MKNLALRKIAVLLSIVFTGWFYSCSKGGDSGTTPPVDPCSGKTIIVTPTVTKTADPCVKGSITIDATGSTNFTYSIDAGAFQASGTFTDVAGGNHTISVKDGAGCVKTASVSVASASAGPLFITVKSMMQTNCAVAGCHNGTQSPNFTEECNIVNNWNLIKARAVEAAGTVNQMPQPPLAALSQADRDKITNWVNAGHKYSD